MRVLEVRFDTANIVTDEDIERFIHILDLVAQAFEDSLLTGFVQTYNL